MYGTGRAGRYEVTCKRLDIYEGPHLTERKIHQKVFGDVLNVVASKDDWLMLDDGEGWVLGFDKNLGARVSLVLCIFSLSLSLSLLRFRFFVLSYFSEYASFFSILKKIN
jgi:hypothetical protein